MTKSTLTRTEIEGFNEKYPIEYLVDYLKEIFRMEKAPVKQHEWQWKASGVKSWRELFILN